MGSTRATPLQTTVCAHARVKEPTLAVRRLVGGYGLYNPIVNRITLDSRVVQGLNIVELTTLVAHEVGHVRQRSLLLQNAVPYIVLFFLIVSATFYGVVTTHATSDASVIAIMGAMTVGLLFELFKARWKSFMDQMELEADAFADSYVGQVGAARAIGSRCESLLV